MVDGEGWGEGVCPSVQRVADNRYLWYTFKVTGGCIDTA